MTVVVSDEQVVALRAFLTGGTGELVLRHWRVMRSDQAEAYYYLVHTAFVTAARRRFSPTYTRADLVRFVAEIRAVLHELCERPDLIEPLAGENLLRQALGDPVTDDRSSMTRARARAVLLLALVNEEDLDDAGLDAFLDTARTLTGQWFGG